MARELGRYQVDIAALSETRLSDKEQLTEIGGGYTFFWSGRKSSERREDGVGFAIKNQLVKKLDDLPEGLNDRLMKLKLLLGKTRTATLISVHAPTMANPVDVKDKFYEELEAYISTVSQSDKLILLGDFNSRVSKDHHAWEGVLGHHGIGKCNSDGLRLLKTCTAFGLIITNTLFCLPTRNKTSRIYPRSRHWHLIDFIIFRSKDRQDVKVTKSMCGAECWTDHRLIISKTKLQVIPMKRLQGQKALKRLDVTKLKIPKVQQKFATNLEHELSRAESNDWEFMKETIYSSALQVLGSTSRKHQDRFDENDIAIQTVLKEKRQLFRAHQNNPKLESKKNAFANMRREVQKKLRNLQNTWLSKKAEEIQGYADSHDMRRFYDGFKCLYEPQSSKNTPILSADSSKLITDKKGILERWAEHFNGVLNQPSKINDEAI